MEEKKKKTTTSKKTTAKRKVVKKDNKKAIEEKKIKEEIETKQKKANIVIVALLLALSLMFLVLLTNKTFFRNTYKNNKLELEIPLFMYFVKDDGSTLTFKTLRKSQNVREYFNEYFSDLENYDVYSCNNGKIVYYNSENKNAIYDYKVDKKFAIKTITIKYDIREENTLCN